MRLDGLTFRSDSVEDVVQKLEARVSQLENRPSGSAGGSNSKPLDLMNHKGLSTVATFTGKSSDYEVWASKMRNLLCQSSQDYKYVIKFVEEQSDDFINDEYVKYLRKYGLDSNRALELAEQMWFVIAAKTDGQAYHLLRFLEGNEDGHRGVMAWYR